MTKKRNTPRRQCKHCPWKKGSNPREIPGQYCEKKHEADARVRIVKALMLGEMPEFEAKKQGVRDP